MLAHRVKPGDHLKLSDIDPDERGPFEDKHDPKVLDLSQSLAERLDALQEKLYAAQQQSLLVVLQAMDTGGKDGVLRSVVGPLDSRGVHVVSFKAPTPEERAHDFLWRCHVKTPRAGEITFFNRSYYEDVLVARVLDLVPKATWKARYELISDFERMLEQGGTTVVKVYLHISKEEQKARLEARLADERKHWKFDPDDLKMRARWDDFRSAYEDALTKCTSKSAPWYVVPANRKWYRDLAMREILVETLEKMDPHHPQVHWDPKTIVIPD
ncbi:MAG: PPK2 family polyphosphate kinase [Polyangia bacterium]